MGAIALTDGLHFLDQYIHSFTDGPMKLALANLRDAIHLDVNGQLRPYTPQPNDDVYEDVGSFW